MPALLKATLPFQTASPEICFTHSLQASWGIWFTAWKQHAFHRQSCMCKHMWGKKTDRGKGRWIGALAPGSAMWPRLQMYSVFGSTDPTHTKTHTYTHIDNGPKTEAGPLTESTNATHPPRDSSTWAAHSDDWITPAESHKTIRPSKNELIYGIVLVQTLMTCLDKTFPISKYDMLPADWINWRSAFITFILLPNYRPTLLIQV